MGDEVYMYSLETFLILIKSDENVAIHLNYSRLWTAFNKIDIARHVTGIG
jgi:hypothetical protein